MRDLAEAFQWTPQQVGKLTLYQLKMLCSREEDVTGKKKVKASDYLAQNRDVKKTLAATREAERAAEALKKKEHR